jgi:hypothetical protein
MALSKHMTRIVLIGRLKSYELKTEPFVVGKGVLDLGGGKTAQFTIFNSSANAQNQHTKANDFAASFKEGDLVFVTGQDNRSYSEAKDRHYEDVNVWDFRAAEEDEAKRWVFVYIADVKEMTNNSITLSFINYKDAETLFPINIDKANIDGGELEVGARVKVKGEIFSGMKMDFYGDGEFVTERNAVEIKILHSAMEIEEEENAADSDNGMWD